MLDFILKSAGRGLQKIRDNPQLFYTLGIALIISGAFVFISERFIGIANDAQERLINVRIGSLQDAFAAFAGDDMQNSDYLGQKIREIKISNDTIKSFKIISRRTGSAGMEYFISASDDQADVGKPDPQSEFLYTLASADPANSVTIESTEGNERYFTTARAIVGGHGNIEGVVMTTQTLSMADMVIEQNIRNSIIILVVILLLIMILFLRHSRIIDYAALYKKLQEVDSMKDNFISMASHELRAPLTAIRGYTEFISEAPELGEKSKEYARKIDISAKNLDALVADILDVARIEQGRMSFQQERFDPRGIIEEVAEFFAVPAREKGLVLDFDRSSLKDEQVIYADKERLKQVIVNLASNAIKYTLKGEIKIRQYSEKNRLYIRVSDTGIGMNAEDREKLFGKFNRIRTAETANVSGTGLGLWISAQLIAEMKGNISVESIKGVGSHFIVSFPLAKQ